MTLACVANCFIYSNVSLTLEQEQTPLPKDAAGAVRVGGTRVTLDTVAKSFRNGATAEEVVQQYPSLQLADVYLVFSFILRHGPEVEDYIQQRGDGARAIRRDIEGAFRPEGIRARLLARQPQTP